MKKSIHCLMNEELTAKEFGFPIMTTCKISRTFVNKELVDCFKRILSYSKEKDEKIKILLRLKKIVKQTLREPNKDQLKVDAIEFAEFFKEIEKEQLFYDPITWIDAELDYWEICKMSAINEANNAQKKEFLSKEEILKLLDMSEATLYRRIGNGLPVVMSGSKKFFSRKEVMIWLNEQK